MQTYNGWKWLLIDAATQFGHDKMTFEDRLAWAEANLNQLEALIPQSSEKERPLYIKAVYAIRKAQQGIPTGHLVGVDGSASGIQIMSALTGCIAGATATGLVDPNVRADVYTTTTTVMNQELASSGISVVVPRKDAKQALMTSFYGSKLTPKEIFGEDTIELEAFYKAAQTVAPGAWELLQDLLASWQPYALSHEWKLPDGYDAVVRVMNKRDARIEVDELDHATFTYEFYENVGSKTGLSNAANVIHSIDAYILRTMHRRCNYNYEMVCDRAQTIEIELLERHLDLSKDPEAGTSYDKVNYYAEQYHRSSVADIVILPYINQETVRVLSTKHLQELMEIIHGMLQYQPFPIVTIHDEFKAHANNVDWMRWQYKEILAQLADSTLLDDILSQIHGVKGYVTKLSTGLGSIIRNQANYALC